LTRRKRRPTLPRVTIQEKDNPGFQPEHPESASNPKTWPVAIDTAESSVETMYARGRLTIHQKRVADIVRQLWEIYSRSEIQAFDYSKDRVQSSISPAPTTAMALSARKRLQAARMELGRRNYQLVIEVAGQGRSIGQLVGVAKGSKDQERQRSHLNHNLSESLDDLAKLWGLWGQGPSKRKGRPS
jgi:hypothetical protein